MLRRDYHVYILCNELKTVLYTGVTNDLMQRIIEHYKNRGRQQTFCGRYNVYHLHWHEPHQYINNAIAREKEIKGWRREKKMQLIAEMNPELNFLNKELFGKWPPEELTERF